jgi:hypothetical protein
MPTTHTVTSTAFRKAEYHCECENCGQKFSFCEIRKFTESFSHSVSSLSSSEVGSWLNKSIRDSINNTEEKKAEDVIDDIYKCPTCGYIQSWMRKRIITKWKWAGFYVCATLFIAIIFATGIIEKGSIFYFSCLLPILFLGFYFIGKKIHGRMETVEKKNQPVINWTSFSAPTHDFELRDHKITKEVETDLERVTASINNPTAAVPHRPKTCPECGNQNPADAPFCQSCGESLL